MQTRRSKWVTGPDQRDGQASEMRDERVAQVAPELEFQRGSYSGEPEEQDVPTAQSRKKI